MSHIHSCLLFFRGLSWHAILDIVNGLRLNFSPVGCFVDLDTYGQNLHFGTYSHLYNENRLNRVKSDRLSDDY